MRCWLAGVVLVAILAGAAGCSSKPEPYESKQPYGSKLIPQETKPSLPEKKKK